MRRFALFLFASFLVLPSCQNASQTESDDPAAYDIAVIPKSVGFDFWTTVRLGAMAAAEELGDVNAIWNGPTSETDIAGQVALVESFITQRVDAIVIAPSDAQGLVRVLQEAENAGIPVITIDSNTDPQVSRSFVATNNREAAAKAADLMAELLDDEGEVALVPYIAGASTSIEREEGFKSRLEAYPGLELVATQYSDSDIGKAMSVTEDILTSQPDLDGIFAANEPSVLGAAQAVRSREMTDEIVLIGFDASPREIAGVRDGSIRGLIVQNPYSMGYQGIMQAMQAIEGDVTEPYIDSGSIVITQANVDSFMVAQEELLGEAS